MSEKMTMESAMASKRAIPIMRDAETVLRHGIDALGRERIEEALGLVSLFRGEANLGKIETFPFEDVTAFDRFYRADTARTRTGARVGSAPSATAVAATSAIPTSRASSAARFGTGGKIR